MDMDAPPVFIVGCERSGNTLLRLMLNRSPSIHIPSETYFLSRLADRQEVYGDFSLAHQRWFFIRDLQTNKATSTTFTFPVFKLSIDEAEDVLLKAAPTNYPGAAFALFEAAARKQGKKRWGDKTPRHVFDIQWLAETFPTAQIIHVIRDGRDVASSLLKAGWVSNFTEAAYYWQEKVQAGRKAGRALEKRRYCEVKYEQLVIDPERMLKHICNWLNLTYIPEMLDPSATSVNYISGDWHLHRMVTRPVDASRIYAWKTALSLRQLANFEAVTEELLNELNYEVTGAKIPLWRASVREGIKKLRILEAESHKFLKKLEIH